MAKGSALVSRHCSSAIRVRSPLPLLASTCPNAAPLSLPSSFLPQPNVTGVGGTNLITPIAQPASIQPISARRPTRSANRGHLYGTSATGVYWVPRWQQRSLSKPPFRPQWRTGSKRFRTVPIFPSHGRMPSRSRLPLHPDDSTTTRSSATNMSDVIGTSAPHRLRRPDRPQTIQRMRRTSR